MLQRLYITVVHVADMYIADCSLCWAQSQCPLAGPADYYVNSSNLLARNTGFHSEMFLMETEEKQTLCFQSSEILRRAGVCWLYNENYKATALQG
jgi:hypothetical protein